MTFSFDQMNAVCSEGYPTGTEIDLPNIYYLISYCSLNMITLDNLPTVHVI
jgi:hypothetical protein